MFDYFRQLKNKDSENKALQRKSKDLMFVAAIVVYIIILIISTAIGVTDLNNVAVTTPEFEFRINISDIVILLGIGIAYIISRFKRTRK